MNTTHKIMYGIIGFLVGNLILSSLVLVFAFLNPFAEDTGSTTSLEESVRLIESGNIRKIRIKSDTAILESTDSRKLNTDIDSESIRTKLLDVTTKYNSESQSAKIVVTEEPGAKGLISMALVNVVPGVAVVAVSGTIIGILLLLVFRKRSE